VTSRELARVTVLFVALTLVFAWPLSVHPATRTLPASPDGNLFLWTIGWNAHAFLHQPFAIFDANMYYPQAHTLAYSESLLGSSIFAAPVVWLTGNLALGLNLVALLSVVLCGVGTYVLARRLGLRPAFAILAGLVFAFSPPRFFRLGQAHLTVVQWIPFGLAFLQTYFDSGRRRDLRWAIACFVLQALSSGHGAVFFALAAGALFIYRLALGTPLDLARRVRDVGVAGALMLVPVVLMAIPYRAVQVEMGLRRSLDDWGVVAESFIASPSHLWSFVLTRFAATARVNETADAFLFPGLLPIVLAIVALWSGRSSDRPARRATTFYAGLTVLAVWLAIGPPLGLWQFVYWIPGLNFIRECSRFTILAMLGLAVLTGFGAERIARRLAPSRAHVVAGVLAVALLAEFAAFPLATSEYRGGEIPAADRWLATQPGPFAVAEVPLPNPHHAGPFERAQTQYLLHSAAHWQKTVHGYSGMRPKLHEELYPALRGFPNDESLAALTKIGVDYVVVHVDQYEPAVWQSVEALLPQVTGRVSLVYADPAGRVYRVLPARR
jgi:hypothetical protein